MRSRKSSEQSRLMRKEILETNGVGMLLCQRAEEDPCSRD